ncbi:hypothetical protein Gpo141_00004408 [Globisporangium polare]
MSWSETNAIALVFFATFLPRVLARLVIFVLTKLPSIRQTAEDFRKSCMGSSANPISASFVILALNLSKLSPVFCHCTCTSGACSSPSGSTCSSTSSRARVLFVILAFDSFVCAMLIE